MSNTRTWRLARRAWPAVVAVLVAAGCGGSSGDKGAETASSTTAGSAAAEVSGTVTFVDYGGDWQDTVTKAWLDPFAEANPGVKIQQVTTYDPAKLKAMVEAGNVSWDLVDTAKSDPFDTAATLEKLDCTIVPCKDFAPETKFDGYRAPFYSFATVNAYNTKKTGGKAPEGWADFFDTNKFPGKRAIYKYANAGSVESALLADGVSPEQLYPLDLDRAIKKFESIRKDIIWYETGAQCADMVASGEVTMGQCWNGRMVAPAKAGKPVAIQWNQCIPFYGGLGIPKGSKNAAAAMQLIAYITSADRNAEVSKYIPYGPTNVKAESRIAETFKDQTPTAHRDVCVKSDEAYLGEHGAEISTKLQEWMAK
jgi:putative spermidine/putrescine transport system substrate-binding protein